MIDPATYQPRPDCPECGGTGWRVHPAFGTDDFCECVQPPPAALQPQPARTSANPYYDVQRFRDTWESLESSYILGHAEHEAWSIEKRGDRARIVRIDSAGETVVYETPPPALTAAGGSESAGGDGAATGPVRPEPAAPRPLPAFWAGSRCHYVVDVRHTGVVEIARTQLGAISDDVTLAADSYEAALARQAIELLMRAMLPRSEWAKTEEVEE